MNMHSCTDVLASPLSRLLWRMSWLKGCCIVRGEVICYGASVDTYCRGGLEQSFNTKIWLSYVMGLGLSLLAELGWSHVTGLGLSHDMWLPLSHVTWLVLSHVTGLGLTHVMGLGCNVLQG